MSAANHAVTRALASARDGPDAGQTISVGEGPLDSNRSNGSAGVASLGAGSHVPETTDSEYGWVGLLAGCGEGSEPIDALGDEVGPGCPAGEVEQGLAASPGELRGEAEEALAEPFRFPPTGVVVGEREELHPRHEFAGEADEGAPDISRLQLVKFRLAMVRHAEARLSGVGLRLAVGRPPLQAVV